MTTTAQAETKAPFWPSFWRAQLASIAATGVDFGLLFFCTEVLGIWYVMSAGLGALGGAVTNFLLGRHWSFGASKGALHAQAWRYGVVSLGSLALNVLGVWAVTEHGGAPYGISKAITALAVGFLYNYPLQRGFVFRSRLS